MKKSIISSMLLVALLFASLAGTVHAEELQKNPLTESKTFTDIKGHWAEAQIKAGVDAGYVDGYSDGTFKPNAEVSKAEFTKMLVAALKLDVGTGGIPWYQVYVDSAKQAGIYADDFNASSWTKAILRKEMSLLAVRAGITGYKKDYDINRNLYEATKAGIIQGTAPGVVDSDGVTTRAAAVVVIERVLAIKAGKTLSSDKYATGAAEILWHNTNLLTMLPRYFSDPTNGDFAIDKMSSTTTNGQIACSTSKIIVIDLDDANDPNKGIISSNDFAWIGGNYYYKLSEASGYAVMAFNDIVVKSTTLPEIEYSCTVHVSNDDWYNIPEGVTSPKEVNRNYGILPWDPKFKQYKFTVKAEDFVNNKYTSINGTLLPKGNFSSDKTFRLTYKAISLEGGYKDVYTSNLNPKYNQ